jgi:hypothetical protein
MMEFWLSRSLSHEPFSFFTVEFWLSGSLSDELFLFRDGILAIRKPFTNFSFTWWNLGYHGAFSRNFLSHGGISAITEPFHEIFLSHGGISVITEPFHEIFFHMMEFLKKMHDVGEDSFHIYHKEYLHRIHLVKNLTS